MEVSSGKMASPTSECDRIAQGMEDELHALLKPRGSGQPPCRFGAHDASQDGTFQLTRHGFHGAECRFGPATFDRCPQQLAQVVLQWA